MVCLCGVGTALAIGSNVHIYPPMVDYQGQESHCGTGLCCRIENNFKFTNTIDFRLSCFVLR